MRATAPQASRPSADPADAVVTDCRGLNFWRIDPSLPALLDLYLSDDLRAHLEPHLDRLGALAGGRLDELAAEADRNPPVLHVRDRRGRDEDRIEYHPSYREMERLAFQEFGLHAMSHRGGVLDWPKPFPPVAKYAFQYLFVQAEFGLMCPVSVSDTSAYLLARYGDDALKAQYLPRMLSQDPRELLKGTQFMTERTGGSDVGAIATVARREGVAWRLYGDKWFCSHADADVIMTLARPEGAPAGTAGLALFLVPRRLADGSRNAYRILRLKDKLGTRSMASGEVRYEGAFAHLVGDPARGLKQMLDQVNLSRLSHGVRAAAMMRRCLNEALAAVRHREAFGRRVIEFPLVGRQLMKMVLATEQALSVAVFTADVMGRAAAGDRQASLALRLLTPLLKFRACRDNVPVATGAMELLGGNGYIEEWVTARLVRDAHVGLLWEGTSNINALDAIGRAVGRSNAHRALAAALADRLEAASPLPATLRDELARGLERAICMAERVADRPPLEAASREAASALYHATSAVLFASEGAALASRRGDGRRLLLARAVLDHRLAPRDPLAPSAPAVDEQRLDRLLGARAVPLAEAVALAA